MFNLRDDDHTQLQIRLCHFRKLDSAQQFLVFDQLSDTYSLLFYDDGAKLQFISQITAIQMLNLE